APAVPAWLVVGGFSRGPARAAGAGGGGLVAQCHPAADESLDGGVRGLPAARPRGTRLRVNLGRRDSLHHSLGGGAAGGFWAAVREVWPETAEQRCWVHRIAECWTSCRRACSPGPNKRCTRSCMPSRGRRPTGRSRASCKNTTPSTPRRWPR